MTKNYTNIVLNSLPDREMEIVGSLTAEKMALMREKALKKVKENVTISGFRKGNAPDALVAEKIGEMALLEEAAEIALSEEYPQILEEHNIDAIGRPDITITKIAPGNALEFKVRTSLMPDIKLADYKKIAREEYGKENKTPEVSEAEVEAVIKTIRESVAHQKMHTESGESMDSHTHTEITDADLPEVTDEFVKMIGDFADVADFKTKAKENIAREKEIKEKDKKRTETLNAIIGSSTIELPKIIIQGETEKMFAQLKDDVAKAGVQYDEYLKHIGKTEADLAAEWRDTAVKRAKSQVILNTIAKEENISPAEEDIKTEMNHILEHYGDADRFRVRMYVETFMTNELVLQFLEGQK